MYRIHNGCIKMNHINTFSLNNDSVSKCALIIYKGVLKSYRGFQSGISVAS